jgi:hypothetical protein
VQNVLVHVCKSRCDANNANIATVDQLVDGGQTKRKRTAFVKLKHGVTTE